MAKDFTKIRTMIFLLQIIILFFLSEIPSLIPSFNGIKPNVILLLAFNIALFEKPTLSMFLGIICGVFMDVGFAQNFGFYITILAVLNLLLSYTKEKLKFLNIFKAYIISFVYFFIVLSLSFCIAFIANNQEYQIFNILKRYFISLLYTTSLEFIFYYTTRLTMKLTTRKQKQMKYLISRDENLNNIYSFIGSE